MQKKTLLILLGLLASGMSNIAHSANWLMIKGTEPAKVKHRFFGVAAVTYANNLGCDRLQGLAAPNGTPTGNTNAGPGLNNGKYVNSCRVGPELRDKNDGINIDALVLGARGNIVPQRINYLLAANFGQNAATYKPLKTDRERIGTLTDASVTFSYLPGVRVRAGLFQKPGPEEMMEAFQAKDFIFPTDFVRRVQIERFIEGNAKGTNPIAGQGYAGNISTFAYDADVGRDWGIQLFDAFKSGKWTHTYAAMIGNGNGIHQTDNNSDTDLNLYFSSEYDLPGGKGPNKHGVKLYGYHQKGVRNFIVDAAGTKSENFDRIRYGIGVQALGRFFGEQGHKHRFGMELMYAEGMVLQAATTSCTDCAYGGHIQIAAEKENKARGLTLEYGFYLNKRWQFDVRFARNNLLYKTANNNYWKPSDERELDELAIGFNYHFSPKTRLTVNYVVRDNEAPNPVAPANGTAAQINNATVKTNNANIATGSVGDVLGVRLVHFF